VPSFCESFCRLLTQVPLEGLSPQDRLVARRAFLDGTGVALAGSAAEVARLTLGYVREQGGVGPARVIGTDIRTQPAAAALANGILAHSLDYDDVNHPMMGHPTAVLLPVVYAVADLRRIPGREALAAYALGLELAAGLGRIVNPWHYEQGWHATGTLGTLAAAATASRLLGLDAERAGAALGLAASQAGGLRRNFGSMAKPFLAGHAARCGVEAALLASRGFTAAGEVLEGEMGLFDIFGDRPSRARIRKAAAGLGRPWELTASGLAVKRYPCCAGSHPAVDAVLSLRGEIAGPGRQPVRVVVRVHPLLPRMMIHDRPRTALEAKFSLRFCLAAALEDGRLNLASFTSSGLRRPGVLSWMERIEIRPDLGTESHKREIPTRAEVVFVRQDGSSRKKLVARPLGSPDQPLSDRAVRQKFRDCAGEVFPPARVRRLLALFEELEQVDDLRRITRLLQVPGPRKKKAG